MLDSLVLASVSEDRLVKILIQLSVIILVSRIAALVFKKLGQPSVVGEICAGLMLGPSLFGYFFPEISATIFDKSVQVEMHALKELGLIFLLFLIGLEFDFSHLKSHARAALAISVAGIVLPFASGWILAQWLHPALGSPLNLHGKPIDLNGFSMFMGMAMSITALPVLGRIMMDLNITRTRLASITITAAAAGDAAGWIILAAVTALVGASFSPASTAWMVAQAGGFAVVMIFIVRPVMRKWIGIILPPGVPEASQEELPRRSLSLNAMAVLFAVIFICSIATSKIGIFAIFGAFLLGTVLSAETEFHHVITERLRDFVTVFFLPIFFTSTGLNTDIGSLDSAGWLATLLVCAVAIAGKFGGCSLAARASGLTWRESGCIGVMMNARGLVELIVINKGYELGVIPRSVFCMLVIMAVITTIMTTPMLRWLGKGTELEACMQKSAVT